MNPPDLSALFARLDPNIWLVTAQAGPRRGGLIATFVSPASIVPEMPRMLVGLAKQHFTTELIGVNQVFALHLLAAEQAALVETFGVASGRDQDKFAGLPFRTGQTGCPLLPDVAGWLECQVEATLDIGDRLVFLGAVVAGHDEPGREPLTLKTLLQQAPADTLKRLKELMVRDAQIDGAAIRAFRSSRAN